MRLILSLLIFAVGLFAAISVANGGTVPSNFGAPAPTSMIVPDIGYQVRVEQRVIIRIPRQRLSPATVNMGASRSAPTKLKEQKIGKCLRMDKLMGSRPGPNDSLELVTVDGALIRAYLGDGCLSSEFYAGAYLERPEDGRLCIERDVVHARSGAKCEIEKFRVLVPE